MSNQQPGTLSELYRNCLKLKPPTQPNHMNHYSSVLASKAVSTLLLLTMLLPSIVFSQTEDKRFEFLHFWKSPGELAALEILSTEYENRGGLWATSHSKHYDLLKQGAVSRFAAGIPPTSMQWLTGEDARHIYELDLLESVSDLLADSTQNADAFLADFYQFAIDYNSVDEDLSVMPFSMHNESMIWFNGAIYDELGLEIPITWDALFEQAPIIEAAGYDLFSTADTPWVVFLVFHAILGGTMGQDAYQQLFAHMNPEIADSTEIRQVFEYMRKLSEHAKISNGWLEASERLINKEAAFLIMGDWVKGEFIHRGMRIGEDIRCEFMPKNEANDPDYAIVAIDAIAFPKQKDPDFLPMQRMFAEIVSDPAIQVKFSYPKGSLPVVKDIDVSKLDACAERVYPLLQNEQYLLFNPRFSADEAIRTDMQGLVTEFFFTPEMPVQTAQNRLKEILTHSAAANSKAKMMNDN